MPGCCGMEYDPDNERCAECCDSDECSDRLAAEFYADQYHDEMMDWTEEDEREYEMHEYLAMRSFDDD